MCVSVCLHVQVASIAFTVGVRFLGAGDADGYNRPYVCLESNSGPLIG